MTIFPLIKVCFLRKFLFFFNIKILITQIKNERYECRFDEYHSNHSYRAAAPQTLYNIMIDVDRDEATDEHIDTGVMEKEYEEPDECLAPPDPIPTTNRRNTSDYAGKDGHIWRRKPKSQVGRAVSAKKQKFVLGSCAEAVSVEDPLMLWNLLFDDKIIQEILLHTNEEIVVRTARRTAEKKPEQSYYNTCSKNEILATFGLLYLAGVQKCGMLHIDELW